MWYQYGQLLDKSMGGTSISIGCAAVICNSTLVDVNSIFKSILNVLWTQIAETEVRMSEQEKIKATVL